MPAPSAGQLADFFAKAFQTAQMQVDAKKLVRSMGLMSYAEAMDFVLDVQRKNVLALGELTPSSLIDKKMKLWSKRVGGAAPNAKRPRQAAVKVRSTRKRAKNSRSANC
jgi:hypothetical protein